MFIVGGDNMNLVEIFKDNLLIILIALVILIMFMILNYKILFKIYKKYEEIINYLIMGVLTTIVSLTSYAIIVLLLKKILTEEVSINIATILSWIISVTFAYITNKKYVFKTKTDKKNTIKEFINFYKYRILSLILDLLFMYIFVQIMNMNDMIAKTINQFIIIIVNYVFSKLFIFKE